MFMFFYDGAGHLGYRVAGNELVLAHTKLKKEKLKPVPVPLKIIAITDESLVGDRIRVQVPSGKTLYFHANIDTKVIFDFDTMSDFITPRSPTAAAMHQNLAYVEFQENKRTLGDRLLRRTSPSEIFGIEENIFSEIYSLERPQISSASNVVIMRRHF
jgi:hypothetical protein